MLYNNLNFIETEEKREEEGRKAAYMGSSRVL